MIKNTLLTAKFNSAIKFVTSINKSYLILVATRFFTLFFGLLTSRWLVGDALNPSEYKDFSKISDSLNNIVFAIIGLGIPNLIHKFYTNNNLTEKTKQEFADFWTTINIFRFATYFIGLIIVLTLNNFLKLVDNPFLIFAIFSTQFILIVDLNYKTVCDSQNRTWQFGITDSVSKGLMVLLLYLPLLLKININLYYYILIAFITYLIALGWDSFWQRSFTPWGKFKLSIISDNLKPALYLSFTSIITVVYLFSGQIILAYFKINEFSSNSFSNAYNRVFLTLASVPTIITPILSSLFKKNYDASGFKSAKKYIYYTVLLGLGYFLFILLAGPLILFIIDSQKVYGDSYKLFFTIAPVMLFYPMLFLLSDIFIFFHKEKYQLITASILSVVGVVLQILLTNNYGVEGLAVSFLLVMILDLLIKLILFIKLSSQSEFKKTVNKL